MKRLNQQGAVSLLSVVIFATIITVVIAAYIHSAINQQNEASNYDFGTRAYYSAESGVQDAIRGIRTDTELKTNGQDTCQPLTNGDSIAQTPGQIGGNDFGLGYTCQLMDLRPKQVTGTVGDQLNTTLRLNPVNPSGQYNAVINWSKTDSAAAEELQGRTDTSKAFYPRDRWKNDSNTAIHPVMRVSVISIPKASFNRGAIKQNVFFLNPVSGVPGGNTNADFSQAQAGSQDPAVIVTNSECRSNKTTAFNGYSCERTIRLVGYDFAAYNVYLRMHSVYGETGFRVTLIKNSDSRPVELANTQAVIDVTGKASNVYRRVQQTVPIDGGVSTDTWPDASLVAGDGICKLFKVGGVPAQFQSGCNPLE